MKKPELSNVRRPAAPERLSDEELTSVSGGSKGTGAGAGKATFHPFSISRKTDVSSTPIFQ